MLRDYHARTLRRIQGQMDQLEVAIAATSRFHTLIVKEESVPIGTTLSLLTPTL